MQRRPAARSCLGVDGGTQFGIGLRQVGKTFAQGFEVEHGAANQQRHSAGGGDSCHFAQGIVAKARCGVALLRRDEVDQPVREFGERCRIRLGGADVHVDEHLRRVDADDRDREVASDREGKRRLAARCRSHDQDRRWQGRRHKKLAGPPQEFLGPLGGGPSGARASGGAHFPRKKSLSSSVRLNWRQVGRPWLH